MNFQASAYLGLLFLLLQNCEIYSWLSNPQVAPRNVASRSNHMPWVEDSARLSPVVARSRTAVFSGGPFFGPEEEFECPDEEECEIDWDMMPDWDDSTEGDGLTSNTGGNSNDDMVENKASLTFGDQVASALLDETKVDKSRVRLEMNWQIDECDQDKDFCANVCPDCHGSGLQDCRFCRGAGVVAFGDQLRSCIICQEGEEDCATCRGTGHIAPWATTMEDYMSKSNEVDHPSP